MFSIILTQLREDVDKFRKWAWRSITSFVDHAIQINIGQKDKESQWRVVDLAEFLYTALLYQAMTNRNINAATLLLCPS